MSAASLPSPDARQRFRRAILAWYRRNGRDLPDDPVAMLPQVADIKKRYTALFGN